MDYKTIFDGWTAVHTPSLESALILIDKMYSYYGDIVNISKKTARLYWDKYGDRTCYRFTPSIEHNTGAIARVYCNFCSKEWYIKNQYRVFEFDEVFGVDLGEFDAGYDDTQAAIAALF